MNRSKLMRGSRNKTAIKIKGNAGKRILKRAGEVLAFVMLLTTTACSGKTPSNGISSLYEKGLNMTAQMDVLAENEDFIKMCLGSGQMADTAAGIGAQDYRKPRAVFQITGVQDSYFNMLTKAGSMKPSPEQMELIKKRFGAARTLVQINALSGVEILSVSSILTIEDYFLFKGLDKETTYLFLYDGDYGSMVTFTPYENEIVAATAAFIGNEGLAKVDTAEAAAEFLGNSLNLEGVAGLTVTPVTSG